jgi:hypothetical protein
MALESHHSLDEALALDQAHGDWIEKRHDRIVPAPSGTVRTHVRLAQYWLRQA